MTSDINNSRESISGCSDANLEPRDTIAPVSAQGQNVVVCEPLTDDIGAMLSNVNEISTIPQDQLKSLYWQSLFMGCWGIFYIIDFFIMIPGQPVWSNLCAGLITMILVYPMIWGRHLCWARIALMIINYGIVIFDLLLVMFLVLLGFRVAEKIVEFIPNILFFCGAIVMLYITHRKKLFGANRFSHKQLKAAYKKGVFNVPASPANPIMDNIITWLGIVIVVLVVFFLLYFLCPFDRQHHR